MAILATFPLLSQEELSPLIAQAIALVTGGGDDFGPDAAPGEERCIGTLYQDEQVVVRLTRGSAWNEPLAEAYVHRRLGLIRTTPFTGLIEDEDGPG